MVWAIDQKDQSASNGLGSIPNISPSQQQNAQSMSANMQASSACYATDCGAKCKKGTNKVTEVNGQPGQLSTRYSYHTPRIHLEASLIFSRSDRCPSGKYRSVCCDDGTTMGKCQWRGYRGAGMSCISGCAEGIGLCVSHTDTS